MVFKDFRAGFLIRTLILTIAISALVYSGLILQNLIRTLFSLAFCVVSVLELFTYINKTNKDFKLFLSALIYEDFTNYYSKSKRPDLRVYELFNKLNNKYRKIAYEKEVQYAFLQTIIQHINIGILVLDKVYNIVLSNDYFKELLKVNILKEIKDIKSGSEKLGEEIINLEPGKPILIELAIEGEIFRLSLNASDFKLDGILYRLVSVQDINVVLDEQEVISWQKLIRVLTHEIMNSVTPISSLTSSLKGLLAKAIKQNHIESKHLEYLSNGLGAVQERSEGLLKFTEAYKKLTQLKNPDFERVNAKKLFEKVFLLHKAKLESLNIKTVVSVDEDENLLADKLMLEQVLINLVKNSIQALENIKNPSIHLNCFKVNNFTNIQVIDNGNGITEDKIDKIFIPFFTSKKSGSGIGLSFARQIMQLHKGIITVKSIPGKTIFTLKF